MSDTVYFQTKGINPKYCEAGMVLKTDPDYIHYFDEPCKILISKVKIIPKEKVFYNKKKRWYEVKQEILKRNKMKQIESAMLTTVIYFGIMEYVNIAGKKMEYIK